MRTIPPDYLDHDTRAETPRPVLVAVADELPELADAVWLSELLAGAA